MKGDRSGRITGADGARDGRMAGGRLWKPCLAAAIAVSLLPGVTHAQDVPESVLQAEQQRVEAIARAVRSAVGVFAPGGRGGGSGVVITPDGFALTNFHVTKPCGDYMKCSMADGRMYDAVLVGLDPTGDVALIKLLGRDDFPCADLADSDALRVGDWCFAVGNPFLLATDFQPTVTYGIVSGVHRYQYPAGTLLEYADCIQTDAAINPGNSGGPLYNARGELVGINGRGSFEKRGRVNVGVGYAISINQIKNFLGHLHSGRIVDHATMGATVATSDTGRVVISNIEPSSDAYRRGVQYGDELIEFAGRAITTPNGFKNVLGIYPKGWRVPVSFRREGNRIDTHVRLAGVHAGDQLLDKISGAPPRPPGQPPDRDPDRKPKDPDDPKDQDPEEPKPLPVPIPGVPEESSDKGPKIPEHVAGLIKHRTGFANYYFNELNRDRVWSAFSQHGEFAVNRGAWLIEGEAGGRLVQILIDENQITAQLPAGPQRVDLTTDLDTQLDPPGSGGMLVALYQWKRLLTTGPATFGDVYYLGTAPVIGRPGLHDVVVGTHGVIESRFMFDSTTGHLVALEMYPENNVDPCELYFDDYRSAGGLTLPYRIEVRYGDNVYLEIDVKAIQFSNENRGL